MLQINWKKTVFYALFISIGFLAMQVKFTQIVGSSIKFSLFDFYGPIIGGFTGSAVGIITVVVMQLVNWAVHGFTTDLATLIRFFPMLFAVVYFAKKSKLILLVPIIAMIGFWIHPQGRQAYPFAFYWLIPVVMYFFHDKWIFARALGTTFTAHSVGSVLWIWMFNLKANAWISLIPVVWMERGLMAIGISVTFIVFSYGFNMINHKWPVLNFLKFDLKYLHR